MPCVVNIDGVLLAPSEAARQVRWVVSLALSVTYIGVATWVTGSFVSQVLPAPPLGWILFGVALVLWFAGYLAVFLWWDRRSLPILPEGPSRWEELVLLGARSFGMFQEVRARNREGEELHLVVDARAPRFWEAVDLLEGKAAGSG